MRKILKLLIVLCFAFSSFVFASCDNQYANMNISVDKSSVEIVLGETPNNAVEVIATVSGSKKVCESVFSTSSTSISISTKYLGDGKTKATITGISACNPTDVFVSSIENSKTTIFSVKVIQPLQSIALKEDAITYALMNGNKDINNNSDTTEIDLSQLNLINFTPAITSEKAVVYKINGPESERYSISNNKLSVNNNDKPVIVPIEVSSANVSRANVKTNFNFTLLPQIAVASASLNGEISSNLDMQFIKNENGKNTNTIVVKIKEVSGYNIIARANIIGDTVTLSKSSSETKLEGVSYQYYTFEFASAQKGVGTVQITTEYENYPETKTVYKSASTSTKEIVTSLNVFTETNQNLFLGEVIDVYTSYATEVGTKLFFEVSPTTVIASESIIVLDLKDLIEDFVFYDSLRQEITFDENAEETDEKYYFELVSGQNIFVRAKNTDSQNATLKIFSKSYTNIFKEISFNVIVGVESVNFTKVINNLPTVVSDIYLTNNTSANQVVIGLDCQPSNADLSSLTLTKVGNGFEYEYNSETKQITITGIANIADQTGTLTVRFANKQTAVLRIYTFKELMENQVMITSSSTIDSSAVGYYEKNADGSLNKIAVKSGNTLPLYIISNDAEITNVSAKYQDGDDIGELENSTDIQAEQSQSVEIKKIKGNYYLTTFSTGLCKVEITINGYKLEDGVKVSATYKKIIYVETYSPVVSLELNKYEIEVYSKDTVGVYSQNLSTENIEVIINNGEVAPSNFQFKWFKHYSNSIDKKWSLLNAQNENYINEDIVFDTANNFYRNNVYTFTLDHVSSNDEILLTGEITEHFKITSQLGRTKSVNLSAVIKNAILVDKVTTNNISKDGIYIDLTETTNSKFPIITSVSPETALNKNLVYKFIPRSGTSSGILTIENGIITIAPERNGGIGEIRIVPEDRFVREGANIVEKISASDTDVVITIPIIIADGKSEATAKRIYNLASINNDSYFYQLQNNTVLTALDREAITALNEFKGTIIGSLNGTNEKPTITLENATFIQELATNGKVSNIIFVGSTSNNGFVCSTNNGTIDNVIIDTYINGSNYISSSISATGNAGGIASDNNGTIQNCEFYGSITATGDVGGIACNNNSSATISDCAVNFYTFDANTPNKLTGVNVGTVVRTNDGTVSNCFANNYHSDNWDVIVGTKVSPVNGVTETAGIESSVEFSPLFVRNTKLSVSNEDASLVNVVMLFYKNKQANITLAEQNALNKLNTISLFELINLNNDSIRVISSNPSIISTTSNSITIKNTGLVTLTFFAKENKSNHKNINVYVCYAIPSFNTEINNFEIPSEAEIELKSGKQLVLNNHISSSVVLVNREIELVSNENIKININDFVDTDNDLDRNYSNLDLGGVSIGFSNYDGATILISLGIDDDSVEAYSIVLNSYYVKKLSVNFYNGAETLNINTDGLTFEPIDTTQFTATLVTDDENDGLDIRIYDNQTNDIVYSNQEDSEDYIFSLITNKTDSAVENLHTIIYSMQLSVKLDKFINHIGKSFRVEISPISLRENPSLLSFTKIVQINILPQEIKQIDISHHIEIIEETTSNSASYDMAFNNTLTPGSSGLLKVMLYPTITDFDYITVVSKMVNGFNIDLQYLTLDNGNYKSANVNTFSKIQNGIRIDKSVINTSNDIGVFYFRTILSKDVDSKLVMPIIISIYKDGLAKDIQFNITTKYIDKPIIQVNGVKDKIYLAKETNNTLTIMVPMDQTFNPINLSLNYNDTAPETTQAYVYDWAETLDESKQVKIYTAKIKLGNCDKYEIVAKVNKSLNGEDFVNFSYFTIYAVDILINGNNSHVKTESANSNVLPIFIDIEKELKMNFAVEYNKTIDEYIDAFNSLNINNFYLGNTDKTVVQNDYIINYDESFEYATNEPYNILKNLYFVYDSTEVLAWNSVKNKATEHSKLSLEFDESLGRVFIKGISTGNVNMRFKMQIQMPDGAYHNIEIDFVVNISVYTDEDTPRIINTAEDFLNIVNETDAQDYILMQDIILENYTPISTEKINSFDGNNKVLTIKSFAISLNEEVEVNYALFNTVAPNTLLKNISVNYHYLGIIDIPENKTTINVAGFAITNSGLITNCEVVSFIDSNIPSIKNSTGITLKYSTEHIFSNVICKTSGFVINNTMTGSITNSRVGGTTKDIVLSERIVNTYNLESFQINAQGDIAGFVFENKGLISSSFFNNAYLVNNSKADYDNLTAGFVVNNDGNISMSYTKGVFENIGDLHATKHGITTVGTSAGFVLKNTAKISDCYSNLILVNMLSVGRMSAGFIYQNAETGEVLNCYSASFIKNSLTTQMNFSGIDINQETLNLGIIKNCYYLDENVTRDSNNVIENPSIETFYNTSITFIENASTSQLYYGFAFASDGNSNAGVWNITKNGPELITANNIAISSRYVVGDVNDKYTLVYNSSYKYGSVNNPILIRSAEEFNSLFGDNSRRSAIKDYYSGKNVSASFRLINNISFANFESNIILNSSLMTLTQTKDANGEPVNVGMLEGNGFTISDLSITASNSITDGFGLFKAITNGAIVKNLNIIVGKSSAENMYGITAGYSQCVGVLAGTLNQGSLVNISVSSASINQSVEVLGQNIVGAVVGKVIDADKLINISANNISVRAVQSINILDYTNSASNNNYSTAGGLFGMVVFSNLNDNYDVSYGMLLQRTADYYSLSVSGTMTIQGAIAGGVIGFVGNGIYVQDVCYQIENVDQKLICYDNGFAGGIAGVCYGLLNQVRSEHSETMQAAIEDSISSSSNKGNINLFYHQQYSPDSIGGLVGCLKNKGMINKSYSKLNICNNKAKNAGGLIGFISSSTSISQCYAIGDVKAKEFAGGIIGKSSSKDNIVEFNNVNALNNWSVETEIYNRNAIIGNSNIYTFVESLETKTENLVFNSVYIANAKSSAANDNYVQLGIGKLKQFDGTWKDAEEVIHNTFAYYKSKNELLEMSNYIFRISQADWEPDKWEREENNLFASMKFIATTNEIYINVAEDIELMNLYPNATFIITRMIDCSNYTDVNYTVASFTGTLMGKDNKSEYGFKNLHLNNPLITRAVGAQFHNFTMLSTMSNLSSSAVLIKNASTINVSAVKFIGYNMVSSTNDNSAIIVNNIYGATSTFEDIVIKNCTIKIEKSDTEHTTQNIYAGFIFSQSLSPIEINRIFISGSNELNKNNSNIILGSSQIEGANILLGNVYAGLVGGYSSSLLSIDNNIVETNEALPYGIAGKISYYSEKAAQIGGVIGASNGLKLNKVKVISNLSGSSKHDNDTYTQIGGVAGHVLNLNLTNTEVAIEDGINAEIVSNNNSNAVGGFVGYVGESIVVNTTSKVLKNGIMTITSQADSNEVSVGGIFGKVAINDYQISDAYLMSSISIVVNTTIDNSSNLVLNLGGAIGYAEAQEISTKISGLIFDGNIKFKRVVNSQNISVNLGGIVGYVNQNTCINCNYAFGDLHLIPTETSTAVFKKLNVGGLAGFIKKNEDNNITYPENNYILTTIYNKDGSYNYEDNAYSVYAVVGCLEDDVELTNENINHNTYCSFLTLVDRANSYVFDNDKNIDYLTISTALEIATISENIYDDENSKCNPTPCSDLSGIIADENSTDMVYYVFSDDILITEHIDIPNNCFVVGNGKTIKINTASDNFINEIAEVAVVSGVKVEYDFVNINTNSTFGGFANVNRGIIFSSNVQGKDVEKSVINAYVDKQNAGAFVGLNKGFISSSFSSIKLLVNNASIISGFVAQNDYCIENCYSTGIIECNNSAAKLIGFSNGKTKYCYCISQTNNSNIAPTNAISIFNSDTSISCYYDVRGTQYRQITTNEKVKELITNDLSINFNETNEEQMIRTLNNDFNNINTQIWQYDKEVNFGYPNIKCSVEGCSYMNMPTFVNNSYLINNIGKFEQIEANTSANYILINNLYGNLTTNTFENAIAYELSIITFDTINNDFAGTFDGNNYQISNLNFNNGGLFNNVVGGAVQNIELAYMQLTTTGDNSEIGFIANTLNGGTIQNIVWTNKMMVSINNDAVIGGVVGIMNSGTITECWNDTLDQISGTTTEQTEKTDKITLKLNATDKQVVFGGILGQNNSNTISSCFNEMNIETTTDSNVETLCVGGIIGENIKAGTIDNCFNSGNITVGNSSTNSSYVAGIVGRNNTEENTNFENCHNKGDILADAKETNIGYVGEIKYDTQKITYEKFEKKAYASGIVNCNANNATLTTCVNDKDSIITGGYIITRPYEYENISAVLHSVFGFIVVIAGAMLISFATAGTGTVVWLAIAGGVIGVGGLAAAVTGAIGLFDGTRYNFYLTENTTAKHCGAVRDGVEIMFNYTNIDGCSLEEGDESVFRDRKAFLVPYFDGLAYGVNISNMSNSYVLLPAQEEVSTENNYTSLSNIKVNGFKLFEATETKESENIIKLKYLNTDEETNRISDLKDKENMSYYQTANKSDDKIASEMSDNWQSIWETDWDITSELYLQSYINITNPTEELTINSDNSIYTISTSKQLNEFLTKDFYHNKHIVLDRNIRFTGLKWTSIDFSGTFDGNNNSINGIKLNNQTQSVFNELTNAKINNLVLENCLFNYDKPTVNSIGSFVGKMENSTLNNCSIRSSSIVAIDCENFSAFAGEMSGESVIEKCNLLSNIYAYSHTKDIVVSTFDASTVKVDDSKIIDSHVYSNVYVYAINDAMGNSNNSLKANAFGIHVQDDDKMTFDNNIYIGVRKARIIPYVGYLSDYEKYYVVPTSGECVADMQNSDGQSMILSNEVFQRIDSDIVSVEFTIDGNNIYYTNELNELKIIELSTDANNRKYFIYNDDNIYVETDYCYKEISKNTIEYYAVENNKFQIEFGITNNNVLVSVTEGGNVIFFKTVLEKSSDNIYHKVTKINYIAVKQDSNINSTDSNYYTAMMETFELEEYVNYDKNIYEINFDRVSTASAAFNNTDEKYKLEKLVEDPYFLAVQAKYYMSSTSSLNENGYYNIESNTITSVKANNSYYSSIDNTRFKPIMNTTSTINEMIKTSKQVTFNVDENFANTIIKNMKTRYTDTNSNGIQDENEPTITSYNIFNSYIDNLTITFENNCVSIMEQSSQTLEGYIEMTLNTQQIITQSTIVTWADDGDAQVEEGEVTQENNLGDIPCDDDYKPKTSNTLLYKSSSLKLSDIGDDNDSRKDTTKIENGLKEVAFIQEYCDFIKDNNVELSGGIKNYFISEGISYNVISTSKDGINFMDYVFYSNEYLNNPYSFIGVVSYQTQNILINGERDVFMFNPKYLLADKNAYSTSEFTIQGGQIKNGDDIVFTLSGNMSDSLCYASYHEIENIEIGTLIMRKRYSITSGGKFILKLEGNKLTIDTSEASLVEEYILDSTHSEFNDQTEWSVASFVASSGVVYIYNEKTESTPASIETQNILDGTTVCSYIRYKNGEKEIKVSNSTKFTILNDHELKYGGNTYGYICESTSVANGTQYTYTFSIGLTEHKILLTLSENYEFPVITGYELIQTPIE